MNVRDWIEWGVDQAGEIVATVRQGQVTAVPGGGVVVGQTYYPPALSDSTTQTIVLVGALGLGAILLLRGK